MSASFATHHGLKRLAAYSRNARVRAVIYQILIVGTVVFTAYSLGNQAKDKLERLGLNFGFSFLSETAGFDIGEQIPIVRLEEGAIYFFAMLITAILIVWLLNLWGRSRSKALQHSLRMVILKIVILYGLPILTLFLVYHSIKIDDYTSDSSFIDALTIGILNTVRVSIFSVVTSTILGLFIALMRLSKNWVLRTLGRGYIEVIRNLPFLLHLFFWYFAVLRTLPGVRQSWSIRETIFINNRGIFIPAINAEVGLSAFLAAIVIVGLLIYLLSTIARNTQETTGRRIPFIRYTLLLSLGLPAAAVLFFGKPFSFILPTLQGFNFQDAISLSPEFASLFIAMTIYHGAYISEIIRSGILSVPKGQSEAAMSLALPRSRVVRLVVLPQSLRVILPPLISRYLGLIKSSSLGVAVGFPEIVSIGHSIEFATGKAIEVVLLTIAFYLVLAITVSLWMNWYNARIQFKTGS
jgi:general L-amino acid transport system permease protein